ncbi:Fatty acyl-CoA reductase wat [Araneus ventricosus]|uniref:Fatty acyl-CoA reductase n=1 Tax=Araneus ventricosus TaxID=182803 RepID=A0A4Y2DG34_ARAVE|nr:Fatty acyl-CoA reductase wat [Araneus ventricosus]
MKIRYDSRATDHLFKEGDLVWMYNPKRRRGLSPKLKQNWEGPYTVVKKLNDVVYRVQRSPNSKQKVIHINRLAPYRATDHNSMLLLKNNVLSLSTVIELCRKMRKFEALVYTSTAYSNSNLLNFPLKEEVYRLPFHAGKFLDALKNEDKEKLQELIAHCKPDWPNLYEFSKCLAENVITDTASDLPVAIIRPSIVVSTWKNPIPGYLEENFGITTLSLGIGKGFIKVANGDPNCKLNLVPADIIANAHVLAARSVGTKRCASPLVVNCTATENLHVKLCEYIDTMIQLVHEFPLPKSFEQQTNFIIVPYKYLYFIIAAYYHYLPAIVLDGMLRILRKKPWIYSLYRYFDKVTSSVNFFQFHTFEFERNNLEYLDKLIHPEDRKDLTLDFRDATILGMALSLPEGSPFYDWKIDKKSQCERQRITHRYAGGRLNLADLRISGEDLCCWS